MGDKSLKSKQRDQKQKDAAKNEGAAVAKASKKTAELRSVRNNVLKTIPDVSPVDRHNG